MSAINDDTSFSGTHTPGDAIFVPLRDDATQEETSGETPSTMRSRERRRRKARGSFYSRRRRISGTTIANGRRGSGASSGGGGDDTTRTPRRNRKFASRLGRSRSSFVDRMNQAVLELLNLDAGVNDDDDVSEGDKAAGTGAANTTTGAGISTRRLRRARNPSATGGGTRRRKFGSLLGRSRTSFEERMDQAVAQSIRQIQAENVNFDDDDEDYDDDNTKSSEGDRAAGAAAVGKNEDENRISTATTIRVEDSDEE